MNDRTDLHAVLAQRDAEILRLNGVIEGLRMALNTRPAPEGNHHPAQPVGASDQRAVQLFRMLTRKQHQALNLVIQGKSNQQIANRMGITHSAAKAHIRSLMLKVGTDNRWELGKTFDTLIAKMTDGEYEAAAGIPKDWWKQEPPAPKAKTKAPVKKARRT